MALSDYSGEKLSRANPMVKRVLAASFPEYRGRKIKARLWTHPKRLENYWDGGTRSFYRAIRIADGAVADFGYDNPFESYAHDEYDLPAGILLVEHSYFCGSDMGITIWARHEALTEGVTPALLNG